jgi:hypothetical protein
VGSDSLFGKLKRIWDNVRGNRRNLEQDILPTKTQNALSSLMEDWSNPVAATEELYEGLRKNQPDLVRKALNRGADPYNHQGNRFRDPALIQIIELNSCYTEKLDYVRPLVEAGGDFDQLRQSFKSSFNASAPRLDRSILSLGSLNFREGDKECAAFLLANLIAYDLEKGRSYTLPIDSVLAGIGPALPTTRDEETSRWNAAQAMTENQHALVDYVSRSGDPQAVFLRAHADHPDARQWMVRMEPIHPDNYSRPTLALENVAEQATEAFLHRKNHSWKPPQKDL